MHGSATSLRTRIWRATFSELELQARGAEAAAAGEGLERRQRLAPAARLVRAAQERRPAPAARQLLHRPSVAGALEIVRGGPTCHWVRGAGPRTKGDCHMASVQRFDPFNELVDDL